LETRLSYNKPKFRFSELESDPKIQELKLLITEKIAKSQLRQERRATENRENLTGHSTTNRDFDSENSEDDTSSYLSYEEEFQVHKNVDEDMGEMKEE
jgi:hypothetical protein